MLVSYKKFPSRDAAKKFVGECESKFEKLLTDTASEICGRKNLNLISLAGPSCSGKTTAAKKLIEHFTEFGRDVHVVSIDDFYLDRDVLVERARKKGVKLDYDSEDTIEFDALSKCVSEIFSGKRVGLPQFDFITGKRSSTVYLEPKKDDIFIFEGIQAVYPKVKKLFGQYDYTSIFISVESGIKVGDTWFSPHEVRLIRRIVRDYNFRGAPPEFTLFLWSGVRENEIKNIYPNALNSDFYINSTLPFEINLLSPYLRNILKQPPKSDICADYEARAGAMLAKTDEIEPVYADMLAPNSLCYEFLKREI